MTRINIEIEGELHKNAKVEALLNNVPLRDFILRAIEEKVNREKGMLRCQKSPCTLSRALARNKQAISEHAQEPRPKGRGS